MGMFDTINAGCPQCGEAFEEQTKDGPCHLQHVVLSNGGIIPRHHDWVHGKLLVCPKGHPFEVRVIDKRRSDIGIIEVTVEDNA